MWTFARTGRPHRLLASTDLSRTLAAEERLAWKRLIQVLRHEINNSLAPVRSIVSTLEDKMARDPRPPDWEQSVAEGLEVIGSRAESLVRMTAAYASLTRLPAPTSGICGCARRSSGSPRWEHRLPSASAGGPDVTLRADPDQIAQVLINLVANAVDAALETGGGVRVRWERAAGAGGSSSTVIVEDDGPGLPTARTCSYPSSPPSPAGAASAWCCLDRSSRPTGA